MYLWYSTQVGDREDSNVYIRMKVKNASDVGMHAEHIKLPKTITQQQVALYTITSHLNLPYNNRSYTL